MEHKARKHYLKMAVRVAYLFFINKADCYSLVNKSYDRISTGYDQTWTNHMRDLTTSLIDRLDPQPGQSSIDLTCGTGYASGLLADKTGQTVTGVDASEGMLGQARENYGDTCQFIQADIVKYLKSLPSKSTDIITCCWGLGYSRPFTVLRQIKRVLKPGGKVAIIDNSLFSLKEIMYCSFLSFAEKPDKLKNLMRFKFLPGPWLLRSMFSVLGMKTLYSAKGSKSYTAPSGKEAIEKLKATGAAAGFEYACEVQDQEEIFDRFAEILEQKYLTQEGIKVTHRYLAGIAQK